MPHDPPASVVVTRQVRPEAAERAQSLLSRLNRLAGRAEGFLSSAVLASEDPHTHALIYRFASTSQLDAWLSSPERAAVLAKLEPLLASPPVDQRMVSAPADGVTLVSAIELRPGAEAEHRVLQDRAVAQAAAMGGLLRSELISAVPGAQAETVALLTFTDQAALDRWLRSDERAEALAAMAHLAVGERRVTSVGSFAGWFRPSPAPRWKQAVTVYIALVPVALVVGALREVVLPGLGTTASVALIAAVNVVLLTWLVMPWLTSLLADWLER